MAELVLLISFQVVNGDTEFCQIYSRVPVSPLAAAELVNAAGSNGVHPVWAVAIVPPLVGLVQADKVP